MAFLDELTRRAGQAKNEVMHRTQDFSSTAKLTIKMNETEKKKSQLLQSIGQLYVDLHKNDYEPAFTGSVAEYQQLVMEIEQIRYQISAIKGTRICENCKAEVQANSSFCPKCGNPMPKIVEIIPDGHVKCASCGGYFPNDMQFCMHCGKPTAEKVNLQIEAPAPAAAMYAAPAYQPVVETVQSAEPTALDDTQPTMVVHPAETESTQPAVETAQPETVEVSESVTIPQPAVTVCTNCGNPLKPGARFCPKCGTAVE